MPSILTLTRRRGSRRVARLASCLLGAAALLVGCSRAPGGELQALLRQGDTAALENRLKQADRAQAAGQMSEAELRDLYLEFGVLDGAAGRALDGWLAAQPDSYHAHLLRGLADRRQAGEVRGQGPLDSLPQARIDEMNDLLRRADLHLSAALQRDDHPLIAAYQLLDVLGQTCQRERMRSLLEQVRGFNRYSSLVHNRYQFYLAPRRCGSYEQMGAFIKEVRADGMPPIGVLQLEAIEDDDRAQRWLDEGYEANAVIYFRRALDKGRKIGGQFQADWLANAQAQRCKLPALKTYCQ